MCQDHEKSHNLIGYIGFSITGSERQLAEKEEYLMKVSNAAFPMKLSKSLSLKILRISKHL